MFNEKTLLINAGNIESKFKKFLSKMTALMQMT